MSRHIMQIFLLITVFFGCNNFEDQTAHYQKRTGEAPLNKRDSITFILGEDNAPGEVYYRNAERYYRQNNKAKTGTVITGLYSLQEVIEYLSAMQDSLNAPWGLINLVAHGNPYTGLSVDILPQGQRCNLKNLEKAVSEYTLSVLPENAIDKHTTVAIHSCGIGNNEKLTALLQEVFSVGNISPEIEASPYFEYYFYNDATDSIDHFLAEYYMIHYKMGYKPPERVILKKFKSHYPMIEIPWEEAIRKNHAQKAGEVFSYTFDVPGKWIFEYPSRDSVPFLETNHKKLEWVKQNSMIMQELEEIQIAPENFNWWMRRIYLTNNEGQKTPALWVKGYSTVFTVLKLIAPGEEQQ